MKFRYEKPEVELEKYYAADVITTSEVSLNDDDEYDIEAIGSVDINNIR